MNQEAIVSEILKGNSIVVVGPSGSGKTYWIQNILLPKLKAFGKNVFYSKNGFEDTKSADIIVFDEAETLADARVLEKKYPDESPYHSGEYLSQIRDWHKMYTNHKASVYVISRKEGDIQYLVDHFNVSDWDGRKLRVFKFLK